jgi:hypothetical protein
MLRARQQPVGQLRNRLRLIPGGRVIGDEVEFHMAKLRTVQGAVNHGREFNGRERTQKAQRIYPRSQTKAR